ncbi:MAG: hypothetical protein WD602_01690 [Actinomycetota bacterium]
MTTHTLKPGVWASLEHPEYADPEDSTFVAFLGILAVMFSLAMGVVVAVKTGDLWAQDAAARAADKVRAGQIGAIQAWNPAVLLFGISLLMTSVVLVLRRIIKTIQARGEAMVANLPRLISTTH